MTEIPVVETLLEAQGLRFSPEPFSPWCRRLLAEPIPVGASVAARFGLVYIQDRSSMLPPLALAPEPDAAVLDLCASPGGKTGFLAQLVGSGGFVLGNEPSPDRLATLRRNLAGLGLPHTATCGSPGEELPSPRAAWRFILLDPPCSGWGTAEKHPRVLTLWRPEKVAPLIALQRRLLRRAFELLAPGGRLLYSTCTTNPDENEAQVLWANRELGLDIAPLAPFPGFSFHDPADPRGAGTLRVDGEGSQAQGFFLALLAKPGPRPGQANADTPSDRPDSGVSGGLPLPEVPGLAWDALPPGWCEQDKDTLYFLPAPARGLLPSRRRGWPLGSLRAGRFRPRASARVLVPPSGQGPGLDADEPGVLQALLSGQSLRANTQADRMGLYFQGLPLGLATIKGGRVLWSDR